MTPQRDEGERMLRLARRDRAAFEALLVEPTVALAVALFHAQQAAEKALKGRDVPARPRVPTHA